VIARGLATWLAAAAATLALGACSTADFAYRHARLLYDKAPTWMLWSVDDYLDLTAAQKDLARERLDRALEWHRRQELPRYAALLHDLRRQLDAGLDEPALRADHERLRAFYRETAEHLLPDAADLFARLDPEQVEDLAHRLDKADARMLKEAKRSREKGIARTLEHLQAWTGPLSGSQRELVKSRMRALPDLTHARVAEWRVRQARLVALLRERPARDDMIEALRRLLFAEDEWRDPSYAQAVHARDDAMIGMLADLARTLTPEQADHIRGRIDGLLADIAQAAR
jgi:hypothetical protein